MKQAAAIFLSLALWALPAIGQEYASAPDLTADSALVVDQIDGDVVFSKNPNATMSIASITKLMTAMVTLDAGLPMEEPITISEADVDTYKHSSSRLPVGTVISRAQALVLALMASENRAAAALARTYPTGRPSFIGAMNRKADALGMDHSRFVDPTGLFQGNISTATDLVKMVRAAYRYAFIRHVTTAISYDLPSGEKIIPYRNTNALVRGGEWEIGLSKTGFIREAGHCLVMQASVSHRPYIMVILSAEGKNARFADADRVRHWLESNAPTSTALNTRAGHPG